MLNVLGPSVGLAESQAVSQVLHSHWIGAGPRAEEFKAAWAKHISGDPAHLVTLHNCTAGLFAAVDTFTQPGDTIVVLAIHFVGAGNAVLAQGRRLALCDVNPHTLNIDPSSIPDNAQAIIVNHYGGIPCEVDAIPPALLVIEDAACAPASTYWGTACGTLSEVGLWSLDAMKVMTAGGGGIVWLDDTWDCGR